MTSTPGAVLSQRDILTELGMRDGLIPINLDLAQRRILWADLTKYHCYHGFFHDALNSWAAIRGASLDTFTSSLDILESIRIPNSLAPTGFIFHAGRCGSTLLAQVLARSRENIVFGEAAPHNQIWNRPGGVDSIHGSSCQTGAEAIVWNLFLAMGRRRLPSYRSHIVKFTSFNILRFRQIRAAFPGVPALFLFREPGEMLESYFHSRPAWMGREQGIGVTPATPFAAVDAFFRAALSICDPDFRCLDYARLTPESMPQILTFLRLNPNSGEQKLMQSGFSWDAKSGSIPRPFVPRRGPPASDSDGIGVPDTLRELYAKLTVWQPLSDSGPADY